MDEVWDGLCVIRGTLDKPGWHVQLRKSATIRGHRAKLLNPTVAVKVTRDNSMSKSFAIVKDM